MTEEKIIRKPYRKLVAIDFDGVIHSYSSPWTNAATISDPPTPGAMVFLRDAVADGRFKVVVVSSRLNDCDGRKAVEDWIAENLLSAFGPEMAMRIGNAIEYSEKRPPAHITIDDRGWRFDGVWPDFDAIAAFRPWNKRPTVDGAPVMSADELPVPERMARYAAAQGRTVDEVLADPEVAKPRRAAVTQRDLSPSSLDAAFSGYANVEALILDAVPVGTTVVRACAGGDLGWRIGFGWLSAEGAQSSSPDQLSDFVRRLAAIPGAKGEKPRNGDPELVARTLAAGRAL